METKAETRVKWGKKKNGPGILTSLDDEQKKQKKTKEKGNGEKKENVNKEEKGGETLFKFTWVTSPQRSSSG